MQGSAEALLATLSFLQPSIQDVTDLPGADSAADLDDSEQVPPSVKDPTWAAQRSQAVPKPAHKRSHAQAMLQSCLLPCLPCMPAPAACARDGRTAGLPPKRLHAQAQLMVKALQPLALRRLRADTGARTGKQREIWVPLRATPAQRAAYCSVLVRSIDVLTDPKPPRHAGHRAAQIRGVCSVLRKAGPVALAACPDRDTLRDLHASRGPSLSLSGLPVEGRTLPTFEAGAALRRSATTRTCWQSLSRPRTLGRHRQCRPRASWRCCTSCCRACRRLAATSCC